MKLEEQLRHSLQTPFFKNSSVKEIEQNIVFFDDEFIVEIKNKLVTIERIKEKKTSPHLYAILFLKTFMNLLNTKVKL